MKKKLKQQEVNRIKKLISSADEADHELAYQLLKGAKDLTPSFLTYMFCRAFLGDDKDRRKFFQKLLRSTNKEILGLGKKGFSYQQYSSGTSEVKTLSATFYYAMHKALSHPLIKARTIFAYCNQSHHQTIKTKELAPTLLLLAIEFGMLKAIKSIREIDIPYISTFPKGLETLPNLKKIISYSAKFNTFPPHFKLLKKLEQIYFWNLLLDETLLCPDIFQLPNLREIRLPYSKLKGTPELWEAICNSTELEHLSLKLNRLTNIPAKMGKLRNLISLDISQNPKLNHLDIAVEVFQLPKLKKLSLNNYGKHQDDIRKMAKQINPRLVMDFYFPSPSHDNIPAYARDDD